MAIKKKDRSFEQLMSDVDWDDIPVDYIETITILLDSGESIIIQNEQLREIKSTNELFDMPGLDQLATRVRNIDVKMDTARLKTAVQSHVKSLLGKHFAED